MGKRKWRSSMQITKPSDLRQRIASFSTEPFADLLTLFTACAPSPESIEKFAEKNPDKWASALLSLSKLAGYTEKSTVEHNHIHTVMKMSDAEILRRLEEIRRTSAPLYVESENIDSAPLLIESKDKKGDDA